MNLSIRDIIIEYTDKLENISSTPRLDIEILISKVLGYENKIDLMMNYDRILTDEEFYSFIQLFSKREQSMPIAYIINKREFMGYDFYVDERVLIPRPDTEIIVEEVINIIVEKMNNIEKNDICCSNNSNSIDNGDERSIKLLDMCVGSGAIALSTSKYLSENQNIDKNLEVYGVDISTGALEVSKLNMKMLEIPNVELIESDLFNSEKLKKLEGQLDVIVSNPPYIEDDIVATLSKDVKDFEPVLALAGGDDGMDFYNSIIESAVNYLKKGGTLIFESGHDQAVKISDKMKSCGFENIYTKKDLQGFERAVIGTFIGKSIK